MNQVNDPPSAQRVVRNTSTPNVQAGPGPYVDQSLTKQNVDSSPAPTPDVTAESGPRRLGNIRPYYAEDQVEEIDQTASNPGVDPPPHSPNSWRPGRDPYKNNGLDPYLNAQ